MNNADQAFLRAVSDEIKKAGGSVTVTVTMRSGANTVEADIEFDHSRVSDDLASRVLAMAIMAFGPSVDASPWRAN